MDEERINIRLRNGAIVRIRLSGHNHIIALLVSNCYYFSMGKTQRFSPEGYDFSGHRVSRRALRRADWDIERQMIIAAKVIEHATDNYIELPELDYAEEVAKDKYLDLLQQACEQLVELEFTSTITGSPPGT